MSHLTSSALVDPRVYKMVASLSDLVLVLERFCPGTHAVIECKKPLGDMKDTLLAWSLYKLLVRHSRCGRCKIIFSYIRSSSNLWTVSMVASTGT